MEGYPFPIQLIGLDSAWLWGEKHESGKIWLTADQVMRLASDFRGEPLPGFRIALVHHPLNDLVDGAECRRHLADCVDLLLRGHLHEPEVLNVHDPDRLFREIAAGCLYEGQGANKYPNACHVIEVHLDASGRPQRSDFRFRGWSERGHWFDDGRLYRRAANGRLTEWLVPPPPQPPRRIGVFVGRRDELRTLEAALLPESGEARPVAVCALDGMPGVGKSYLVDYFADQHRDRFPGGYRRLVLRHDDTRDARTLLNDLADQLAVQSGGGSPAETVRRRLLRPATLLHVENVDALPTVTAVGELAGVLSGCLVVITGRFQGLGRSAGWIRIPVRPFDPSTALQQLAAEFRAPKDRKERADFERLARALGYLPLALHLAAGHLQAGRSVDGFLAFLRQKGLAVEPTDPADPALTADRSRAILRSTFELSLDLLEAELGRDSGRLLEGFAALAHAPASGFGRKLGAAIAGLPLEDFESLVFTTTRLSLLEVVPGQDRPDGACWLHPLLADLLRERMESTGSLSRMTEWFVSRMPVLPAGKKSEQGVRWKEVEDEAVALVAWLSLVPAEQMRQVERAGSVYAQHNGPFLAWMDFCERALTLLIDPDAESNVLWTLTNVARAAGVIDRAMWAAERKRAIDRARGAEREAALAAGAIADILQARGELDEALRIRQQEQLPVFERLGYARDLLVAQAKIAIILLLRNRSGDRDRSKELLCLALASAEKLRIPEAKQIREILQWANTTCP